MAWQGIPFRVPFDTNEFISIALNSIPKIAMHVETETDYRGLWLTAGAALAGGIIPALIAGWTFWQNTKNLKKERESQQAFLVNEREKQHQFLIDERKAQSESLEADRQTQLSIAKTNFNMQVLSANRQAWINTLRNLIADFSVASTKHLSAQYNFITAEKSQKNFQSSLAEMQATMQLSEEYKTKRENFHKAFTELEYCKEEVKLLCYKISLMLNPNEGDSESIINAMLEIQRLISNYALDKAGYAESLKLVTTNIDSLINSTHSCLKSEWERVKQGN
ncbi:TPA: hypothetical protein U2Q33_000746 [Citrobacter farmeri]|nr:hypothetical protein [Citrobacter farmeri]